MGYREYVENAILESGLEETDELLDIFESADTAEDLEAIEGYLTEKKGDGRTTKERLSSLGKSVTSGPKNAYVGARTNVGNFAGKTAAKSARKKMLKGDKSEYSSLEDFGVDVNIAEDEAFNRGFSKATGAFDKGAIAVGATALLAATAAAGLKIRKAIKAKNSTPAKQIEKQMKDLETQAKDVAARCKKGEITEKEAKVETKKIQAQMKKLAKEAAKIAKTATTNESVDMDATDIQLAIFESCEEGEISEEDRDELLEMLEA